MIAAVNKTPVSSDARTRAPANVAFAAASTDGVSEGLDWQAFSAAYFPGRRRHDLEALIAYGAYRHARLVEEPSAEEAERLEEAESGTPESTALQAWEGEGGAPL